MQDALGFLKTQGNCYEAHASARVATAVSLGLYRLNASCCESLLPHPTLTLRSSLSSVQS
jgi:hypothetical protein